MCYSGFPGAPAASTFELRSLRESPVVQDRFGCSQMVLELDQPRIILVRPSQIQFFQLLQPGFLDRLPEQSWHASQFVKPFVRTTVLVDDRLFMSKRENAGDRAVIYASKPYGQSVTEAVH